MRGNSTLLTAGPGTHPGAHPGAGQRNRRRWLFILCSSLLLSVAAGDIGGRALATPAPVETELPETNPVPASIIVSPPTMSPTAPLPAESCAPSTYETDYQTIAPASLDGLIKRLGDLGLPAAEARTVLLALKDRLQIKDVRQAIRVVAARGLDPCRALPPMILSITMALDDSEEATMARDAGGRFQIVEEDDRYSFHLRVAGTAPAARFQQGLIDTGLPEDVADQVLSGYALDGWTPDRAVGDVPFDILYQVSTGGAGAPVQARLTMAEIRLPDGPRRIYYFRPDGRATKGRPRLLSDEGQTLADPASGLSADIWGDSLSTRLADFIHPLPQGKFTSGFGWRKHPVLRKSKFHNGVDFSAPRGTPVMASSDGVVSLIRTHRGYGKYVQIDHGGEIGTIYAHLDSFAKGLKLGQKVQRGQVIGYVGRTGIASGNHLYFELIHDGRFIDPMRAIPDLAASPLDESVDEFLAHRKFIEEAEALWEQTPVFNTKTSGATDAATPGTITPGTITPGTIGPAAVN